MIALFNRIFTTPVCFAFICCGCLHPIAPTLTVLPKHFRVQIPFQTDNKGILIDTYWGSAKTAHKLYLDNHSPTWANSHLISGNGSISKSKDFLYSTTTADGKVIEGDVYVCDSICIGQVSFANVSLYNISNETTAGKTDGAIGENIMNKGVWKIDFKQQLISFASSPDSIEGLQQADLLPTSFTNNAIEIEVSFRNKIKKQFELDLGYNGWLIMPEEDFTPIIAGNNKVSADPRRFSTPAGTATIENISAVDSIMAGHHYFQVSISSNKLVKEKLIGLGFFYCFEFIIIDYINKQVYISKKKINE